jgi:hypothetical protein
VALADSGNSDGDRRGVNEDDSQPVWLAAVADFTSLEEAAAASRDTPELVIFGFALGRGLRVSSLFFFAV